MFKFRLRQAVNLLWVYVCMAVAASLSCFSQMSWLEVAPGYHSRDGRGWTEMSVTCRRCMGWDQAPPESEPRVHLTPDEPTPTLHFLPPPQPAGSRERFQGLRQSIRSLNYSWNKILLNILHPDSVVCRSHCYVFTLRCWKCCCSKSIGMEREQLLSVFRICSCFPDHFQVWTLTGPF